MKTIQQHAQEAAEKDIIREEFNYRYQEYIGISTEGKREPTTEEIDRAFAEADKWEKEERERMKNESN